MPETNARISQVEDHERTGDRTTKRYPERCIQSRRRQAPDPDQVQNHVSADQDESW